jgi:hypothetical protein
VEEYKQEIDDAISYVYHLRFDKHNPWHRNMVALYCSLIEYSDCLVHLVENKKNIGVPIVFRGMLEAFVDFKNLTQNELYFHNMEASYIKEWLKVIEEANQNNNAYLALIGKNPKLDLDTLISDHKTKLKELENNKFEALSQFKKFSQAGMLEEYKSVYNFACSHSHNNIRSLFDRFFIINEAENDFEIELFKEEEPDEHDSYLMTGKHYLRNSSHNIHKVLKTGHEDKFPV